MALNESTGVKGYAKRPPGRHSYGDNLELHVSPLGKSVWKMRIRTYGKNTVRKLGEANSFQNVSWARAQIDSIRSSVSVAEDSLGFVMTKWAESKLITQRWSQEHHDKTISRIEKALEPLWSSPIHQLTRPGIVSTLEQVADVDTGGRVYSWLRDCLESCVDRGELPFCVLGRKPQSLTLTPAQTRRRRKSFGSDYEALRELYRAIRLSNSARSVRLASQFLILTGLRIGNVLEMRVDYCQDNLIEIPRDQMKIKDSFRGPYRLPLASPAASLMVEAIESSIDGWLFPGPRSRKPLTHEAIEQLFRRLSDRKHQPHGTRTSLRTFAMEELRARTPVANVLLDHEAEESVGGRHYDRTEYFEERKEILEAWAELLAS